MCSSRFGWIAACSRRSTSAASRARAVLACFLRLRLRLRRFALGLRWRAPRASGRGRSSCVRAGDLLRLPLHPPAQQQPDRHLGVRQQLAEAVDHEPLVRLVARTSGCSRTARSSAARRRSASRNRPARRCPLRRAGRALVEDLLDRRVQLARADALVRLLEQVLRQVEHRLHVPPVLRGDERDRGVVEVLQLLRRGTRANSSISRSSLNSVPFSSACFARVLEHQVPLVDDEHDRLVLLGDVLRRASCPAR